MRLPNLKEKVTGADLLTAAAVPMKADASLIRDVTFNQAGGDSIANLYLQNNNNGVTYDSAELKYDSLLIGIARSVKDNNSDYASMSLADIMSEWDVRIRGPPTGEVYGWQNTLDAEGILNMTHPDEGYIPWISSEQFSGAYDEMAISVNFFGQLDFNHNGTYDALTEKLTWDGPNVTDAFTGYDGGGLDYSSDANALNVVPEPVTVGLMGLGGLLALAARRLSDYGRTY
jgi:hypothetical protein